MPPQVNQSSNIPPPPPGYTLDSAIPPPPPGYTLDSHTAPNFSYQPAGVSGGQPTEIPGQVDAAKKFLKDIPIGIAKSGAQTVQRMAEVNPPLGVQMPPHDMLAPAITPNTPGEKFGAGVEQTGEMMAAGNPLRAGVQGLAARLPFLGKYMGPGARVAAEAMNASSNAAMHGQDPNAAALVGAGGAAVAESLPFLSIALKKSAVDQYTKALAPTKEANKYAAQKVVPGLLDRGVVGSPTSISEKATSNLAQAGNAVKAAENAIPASSTSDIIPVLQRLDQMKSKYTVGGSVPESRAGTVDYIDSLKNDIATRAKNGQMPTSDLIQFRRLLDEPVAQASGYAGKTMLGNKAIDKAAANSMREILNSANPDLAAANASYSFWSNVRKVSQATAQRQTGQQGAFKTLLTGIGLASGLSHGGLTPHGAGEAAGMGALAYVIGHAVLSPQWRTASAVVKNRIADALATDNAAELFRGLGDFAASTASQSSGQPSGQSGSNNLRVPSFLQPPQVSNQ